MNDDQPNPTPQGVLVIDKPAGPTSMQVCARIRAKLRAGGAPKRIKVGHAGTLDPLATGVLVVLVGKATKSVDRVMATDKRYAAEVDLGAFTSTDDREGERTEIDVAEPPSLKRLTDALAGFQGRVLQRPPAFSAVKIGGRRAYALARRAEDEASMPRPEPRPVLIHDTVVTSYAWPIAALDIHCGKGTYIRSIARDLGVSLGTGGHLASLRRTAVGRFTIERSVPLDDLPDVLVQSDLSSLEDA